MPENPPVSRSRLLSSVLLAWLGSHLVIVAGHVALVFLYSVAIAPGLPPADYTAFAERSGPWFSIFFGGPVFYLVGRWLRSRLGALGRRAALAAWTLYCLTDLTIVLAVHGLPSPILAGQWIVSQAIKLLAVLVSTASTEIRGPADREAG